MKGKYLIAIAFLASWTVITASKLPDVFVEQCPAGNECPPKLISHETDCTKYYECQDGQKKLMTCAAGLYFSKSWRGCVDRQISDCPITTPEPPTTPDGECKHGELIEHECKCEKYYECVRGRKALRECPPDHHFEPAAGGCQPGPCGGTTTTTTTTSKTPPPLCREGELIPHECKCKKYYLCKGGRKALRECDPGMHFDNVTLKCVPGENCNEPLICIEGDRKNHDCNCEQYYECFDNDWNLHNCSKDLHFNNATKTCTDKESARCEVLPPGYCDPRTPPLWHHECDCRLYYKCENNVKKLETCNWGDCFDEDTQKCYTTTNVNDYENSWDPWT